MALYAESNPLEFIVTVGDNFYTLGVSSTSDSMWASLWSDVYLTYSSLRVPWYSVLGNHDYGYGDKGVAAQIGRTAVDEYWNMPATNYSRVFDLPGGGKMVIVFIDTTTLAPSQNKCCNQNG